MSALITTIAVVSYIFQETKIGCKVWGVARDLGIVIAIFSVLPIGLVFMEVFRA